MSSEFDQIWLSLSARQYMFFFLREESFIRSEFSSVEEAEDFGLWTVSPRYRVSLSVIIANFGLTFSVILFKFPVFLYCGV